MSSYKKSGTSVVESLEGRRLFCAAPHADSEAIDPTPLAAVVAPAADGADVTPPTLVGVRIEGTPRETFAVVLTFSEPLDPVRAQRVSNYQIARARTRCEINPLPDPDPFDDVICFDRRQSIEIDAATYDDAARTVTLVPRNAFNAAVRMRRLRVSADAERGVTDAAGNRLDGNQNGTPGGRGSFKIRFSTGRKVTYREPDGDRVTLRVEGPGKANVLRRLDEDGDIVEDIGGGVAQVILTGDRSSATTLTGSVTPGPRGDGVATIGVVRNADGAVIAIAQDPSFVVGGVES
jgi:hypothetical protein